MLGTHTSLLKIPAIKTNLFSSALLMTIFFPIANILYRTSKLYGKKWQLLLSELLTKLLTKMKLP